MCGPTPCEKELCTWSEKYRFQCEARFIARLPDDRRTQYLKNIARRRGESAMEDIKAEARRQWRSAKV